MEDGKPSNLEKAAILKKSLDGFSKKFKKRPATVKRNLRKPPQMTPRDMRSPDEEDQKIDEAAKIHPLKKACEDLGKSLAQAKAKKSEEKS